MAFVADRRYLVASAPSSSFEIDVPDDTKSGDLVLAFVGQDTGGSSISTPSGFTAIGPAQAQVNATRMVCLWAWYDDLTSDTIAFTGANEQWAVLLVTVRGAHPTTPIDAVTRAASNAVNPKPAPTLTVSANTLLLYAFHADGSGKVFYPPKETINTLYSPSASEQNGATSFGSGWAWQASAGTTTAYEFSGSTARSGVAWAVAIADDGTGARPAETRYDSGTILTFDSGASTAPLSDLSIDNPMEDVPLSTLAASTASSAFGGSWPDMAQYTSTETGERWVGNYFAQSPALDLSVGVHSFRFSIAGSTANTGSLGYRMVLIDSLGNWGAVRVTNKAGAPSSSSSRWFFFDADSVVYTAGSVTPPDLSDIVTIALLTHRNTASTTLSGPAAGYIRKLLPITLIGGSAQDPCTHRQAYLSWHLDRTYPYNNFTGQGQALMRHKVIVGDGGATQTYFDSLGFSCEFPMRYGPSGNRRLWQVGANMTGIEINAGPIDTIRLRNSIVYSDLEQKFTIASGSSASASYDFGGAVFLKTTIELLASGVVMSDVSAFECPTIKLTAGSLQNSVIARSPSPAALETPDPSSVSDCEFRSSGTGHAIEITAPGTYAFSGNTFEGYGADGTTDAAIYNNSGGAVVLNITGGGDTPTVRNGTGASTTVNNNVSITVENVVVGSSIRVEKVSDGSLVEYRVADATTEVFSVAGSVAYRIKVRKASSEPFYRPWSTTITPTADASITVAQELD